MGSKSRRDDKNKKGHPLDDLLFMQLLNYFTAFAIASNA